MTHEPRDRRGVVETVWLVYYFQLYEMPCEPIATFTTQAAAEAFAFTCREYDRTQPEVPREYVDDKTWNRWRRAQARWEKHHPAKVETCSPAGYDVRELELRRTP